jgi:hypothetical protein
VLKVEIRKLFAIRFPQELIVNANFRFPHLRPEVR